MFLGSVIYWQIFSPILDFRMISDENYTCGSFEKHAYMILTYWQEFSVPFAFQLGFIGVIWQLAKIQATLLSHDFEDHGDIDSSEFSIEAMKQLRDTVTDSLRNSELIHTPASGRDNSL